ncbi:MAG: bifunctional phosphoglucose/phosphomannose isomerase [bacterium]
MEIDKSDMRKIIMDFPSQFKKGLKAASNVSLKHYRLVSPPNNIIICGMGGSALPGEILVNLRPLNFFIHKSYGLPPQAGGGSIIICVSYSGNTEETLSAFKEALKRKLPAIAITTGGELAKIAKKNNIPLVLLPALHIQPRLALGLQFAALLQILTNHYLMPDSFVSEITKLETALNPKNLESKGKALARKIGKRIPLIYTPEKLKGLGLVLKNNFNENAKTLAFSNHIPEMNHNEIVGFWQIGKKKIKDDIIAIILRDKKENPKILKRTKIMENIFETEGVKTEIIDIGNKDVLETIFSTTLLGLWASYYLALDYKIDPTQTKIIEEIKKKLNK